MCNLESEWPAHNQGKTLGWLAREKTQYKQLQCKCKYMYVATYKIKKQTQNMYLHKISCYN